MKDDLPKAYTSYQQALYHLANPKVSYATSVQCLVLTLSPQEPKLWYGIGILYDRYGSFEHAEEAFSSVLKVDPSKSILISDETLFDALKTLKKPMRSTSAWVSSTNINANTSPPLM